MDLSISFVKQEPVEDEILYRTELNAGQDKEANGNVSSTATDSMREGGNVLRNLLTGPATLITNLTSGHSRHSYTHPNTVDSMNESQNGPNSTPHKNTEESFLRNMLLMGSKASSQPRNRVNSTTPIVTQTLTNIKKEPISPGEISPNETFPEHLSQNAQHEDNIGHSSNRSLHVNDSGGGGVLRNMLTAPIVSVKCEPETTDDYRSINKDGIPDNSNVQDPVGSSVLRNMLASSYLRGFAESIKKGAEDTTGSSPHLPVNTFMLAESQSDAEMGSGNEATNSDLTNRVYNNVLENLIKNIKDQETPLVVKLPKKVYCDVCGRDFSNSNRLRNHMKSHQAKPVFQCELCDKAFSQAPRLKRHMLIHTGDTPFECGICGKSFAQSGNLKKHILSHTGIKPYKCDFCGKEFSVSDKLTLHRRIHTGEKPYKCLYCEKRFTTRGGMNSHSAVHTGIKPYECNDCGKKFVVSNELVKHRRVHTGEKPYICTVCGKRFAQISGHKKHLRTHSDERPHECDVCGRSFSQSASVARHMRTHTGDKPFSCKICGKTFSFSGNLAKHKRTHSVDKPYKCELCHKGFRDPSYLKTHMMVHTGHRPYPCSLCTKRFMQTCDLNAHMRTHTGSKPFVCDFCGKAFRQSGHLQSHVILHTDGKIPPYTSKNGTPGGQPSNSSDVKEGDATSIDKKRSSKSKKITRGKYSKRRDLKLVASDKNEKNNTKQTCSSDEPNVSDSREDLEECHMFIHTIEGESVIELDLEHFKTEDDVAVTNSDGKPEMAKRTQSISDECSDIDEEKNENISSD